jgi:hypothetical protein
MGGEECEVTVGARKCAGEHEGRRRGLPVSSVAYQMNLSENSLDSTLSALGHQGYGDFLQEPPEFQLAHREDHTTSD